jgi:hypothetical protein
MLTEVEWSGPIPHPLAFPITDDSQICDPESAKTRDLECLIVGPYCRRRQHGRVHQEHHCRQGNGTGGTGAFGPEALPPQVSSMDFCFSQSTITARLETVFHHLLEHSRHFATIVIKLVEVTRLDEKLLP